MSPRPGRIDHAGESIVKSVISLSIRGTTVRFNAETLMGVLGVSSGTRCVANPASLGKWIVVSFQYFPITPAPSKLNPISVAFFATR